LYLLNYFLPGAGVPEKRQSNTTDSPSLPLLSISSLMNVGGVSAPVDAHISIKSNIQKLKNLPDETKTQAHT
jgi:hypothetical protein